MRGCPFGAYFSSQAATLKAAEMTGNMALRPHSIVHSVIFDDATNKAVGVRLIDELTLETTEYFAKIIFLNASTVASTSILMHSKSARFPEGMDESGSLGHNLMDHHLGVGADGILETHADKTTYGRRPNGFYIPRFRNHSETANHSYRRGYGYQGSGLRQNWTREIDGFGADFKKQLTSVGPWKVNMGDSPKNSVLNPWNQVWGAPNVFCTDGSAMVSAGCQNPSLTYMALTASAADHAVSEMRKGNL